MLELVILGLLEEGPKHGYELRRRIREEFGAFASLSFGSLYPALARLETSGSLRSVDLDDVTPERQAPIGPFTGSLGGERAASVARRATAKAALALGRGTRARKVYAITEKGKVLFDTLLSSNDTRERDFGSFLLRFAFAKHLNEENRIRMLERMQFDLSEKLHATRENLFRSGRDLDRYGRAIAQHACDSLTSDLGWIERVLREERDQILADAQASERGVEQEPQKVDRRRPRTERHLR